MLEDELIALFHGAADASSLDDCAALPAAPHRNGTELVTTDSMVEGTHFRRDWSSPEQVAHKLFQVNLSDLGASGGVPRWALLNLGLPADHDPAWARAFARALREELARSNCALIGGDTFRAPVITLGLTLGGPAARVLTRSNGRPGDALYLTGEIGLALAGYRLLNGDIQTAGEDEDARRARERHLAPRARFEWARQIAAHPGVHAVMDLSDGLFADAGRFARASHLDLGIELDDLPADTVLGRGWLSDEDVVFSGEEFELLFLGEPGLVFVFPCRAIGTAIAGEGRTVYTRSGERVKGWRDETAGFAHFKHGEPDAGASSGKERMRATGNGQPISWRTSSLMARL